MDTKVKRITRGIVKSVGITIVVGIFFLLLIGIPYLFEQNLTKTLALKGEVNTWRWWYASLTVLATFIIIPLIVWGVWAFYDWAWGSIKKN